MRGQPERGLDADQQEPVVRVLRAGHLLLCFLPPHGSLPAHRRQAVVEGTAVLLCRYLLHIARVR